MKEQREGFTFYRSFFETIEEMGPDYYFMYSLIANYEFTGHEPSDEELGDSIAKYVWKAMFPNMRSNRIKWVNGKNGGCPQGTINSPNGRRGNKELTEN